MAAGTASSRHQPGTARISVAAPHTSRTMPVTSTMAATTAAASMPAFARCALSTPAPVTVPTIPATRAAAPRPARPARRVTHTPTAVTAITTRTRTTRHTGEPSSPASTARAAPSAATRPGMIAQLRNRGLEEVLFVCCDGLSGLGEEITGTWPDTTVQTCTVHLIRRSLNYASYGDRKAMAAGLRAVYRTSRGLNGLVT
jgi:Transposase, Mutator family